MQLIWHIGTYSECGMDHALLNKNGESLFIPGLQHIDSDSDGDWYNYKTGSSKIRDYISITNCIDKLAINDIWCEI